MCLLENKDRKNNSQKLPAGFLHIIPRAGLTSLRAWGLPLTQDTLGRSSPTCDKLCLAYTPADPIVWLASDQWAAMPAPNRLGNSLVNAPTHCPGFTKPQRRVKPLLMCKPFTLTGKSTGSTGLKARQPHRRDELSGR